MPIAAARGLKLLRSEDVMGCFRVLFVAGFGPIVRAVAASRELYAGCLGVSFKEETGNYLHTEALSGAKTFEPPSSRRAVTRCSPRTSTSRGARPSVDSSRPTAYCSP